MQLPENIGLRSLRDDDLPLLMRIYRSTREAELAWTGWTTEQKEQFISQQFDSQHRYYHSHFPHAEFYILRHQDQDVGRLYLDKTGDEWRLIDIALLPEWRLQGIGSGVLQSVLADADRAGQKVLLHVEATNPAMSLYRRLGFSVLADNGVHIKLIRQPQPLAA